MKKTNAKPVGSGAYVVKTTSDTSYTLTANANYRDGAPPISDVQYLGLDSNQSGQDMLTTGQIDWTGMFVANPDTVTGGQRASACSTSPTTWQRPAISPTRSL